MAEVFIGTSGWSYLSWRGPFFPKSVPSKDHLGFYASEFNTTELNGVFYRTPTLQAVRSWRRQTPEEFVFAWKASRFITHWKQLGSSSWSSLALMESRLRVLEPKVGPILLQLPSRSFGLLDCLNLAGVMHLNSVIPAGSKRLFWICFAITTSLCACRTIAMRRPLGKSPLPLSTCAGMGRKALTKGTIPTVRCECGRDRSSSGSEVGATSMFILITIRRRLPRPMRDAS